MSLISLISNQDNNIYFFKIGWSIHIELWCRAVLKDMVSSTIWRWATTTRSNQEVLRVPWNYRAIQEKISTPLPSSSRSIGTKLLADPSKSLKVSHYHYCRPPSLLNIDKHLQTNYLTTTHLKYANYQAINDHFIFDRSTQNENLLIRQNVIYIIKSKASV